VLSARRRAARIAVVALLVACVLAGAVPAAIALADRGWASWTDVRPFQDHPAGTGEPHD
jgi:hypothetical protein